MDPEEELVRRYQRRPALCPACLCRHRLRAALVQPPAPSAMANWLLFSNGVSFGIKDPQFGKDVGFFVFKLPFFELLVNWSLVALLVILIVVVVFHYLNVGSGQRVTPRYGPR